MMNLSDRLTVIGQEDYLQIAVRQQWGAMGAAMADCGHPASVAIRQTKSRFIAERLLYVSSCPLTSLTDFLFVSVNNILME